MKRNIRYVCSAMAIVALFLLGSCYNEDRSDKSIPKGHPLHSVDNTGGLGQGGAGTSSENDSVNQMNNNAEGEQMP